MCPNIIELLLGGEGYVRSLVSCTKSNQEKFPCCFVFFQIFLFKNSILWEGVLIWFPSFPKEDRNWEALRRLDMVHTFKGTDSGKRQKALSNHWERYWLPFPEMNLGKTWVKLHSKHMKYSLIHCSSKPLTRIFIIRFWFLSRFERISSEITFSSQFLPDVL